MVILKIKSSTLMETLVATVLVLVIMVVAGLILNNLFTSSIKNSTGDVQNYLHELEYRYMHGAITVPYYESYKNWDISIVSDTYTPRTVIIEAIQHDTNKTIKSIANEIQNKY
jgi:predicted PurR-regulated permease PerM